MAKRTTLSVEAVNAQANALAALCDDGFLDLYGGIQPESANSRIQDQILLATLKLGSPAFNKAVHGQIVARPIEPDHDAKATGVATWARVYKSDHKTPVMDQSVGLEKANILMNVTNIQKHAVVSIDDWTHIIDTSSPGF